MKNEVLAELMEEHIKEETEKLVADKFGMED